MTDWLRRDTAPLSQKVWAEIDSTAVRMAKQTMVGRRIADLDGPRGWGHVAAQMDTFRPAAAVKSMGRARLALPPATRRRFRIHGGLHDERRPRSARDP